MGLTLSPQCYAVIRHVTVYSSGFSPGKQMPARDRPKIRVPFCRMGCAHIEVVKAHPTLRLAVTLISGRLFLISLSRTKKPCGFLPGLTQRKR